VAPGEGTCEARRAPEDSVAAASAAQASLQQTTEMTDSAAKSRRGCFFYGCISSLVLLVLMLGALLVGLHYVRILVNHYTDAAPMELPTVQMSQGEVDGVRKRFEAFRQAVRQQSPTKPLSLSADDINALIANGPDQQALKGKFYVSLEGDQVKGEVSVPLKDVGLSMFRNRYLNGSATFSLSFQNGALSISPQTILVKGKALPEVYMKEIRKQNLAASLTNEPGAAAVLKGLEDIQVKEGKLVVVPKAKE
jgi:hypothetical protein